MHQDQNGNNYPQNNQAPQNQPSNRYTYNNIVNIQHPSTTTRTAVSNRTGNVYGNISQVTTQTTVAPVKTPFSVVKGITQSASSHNSLSTVQHFALSNKKITIPNIVKPPQTMQIQKVKLEVKEEVVEEDPLLLREKILQLYYDSVEEIKCNFKEKLQELFFVQSGGNMVDYPAWKQRPNPHLLSFLNIYRLDDTTTLSTPTATNTVSPSIKMQAAYTPAGPGATLQHSSTHIGIPNVRFSSFSEMNKILLQTPSSSVGQYGFVQGVHTPHVDSVRKSSVQSVSASPIKQESSNVNKDTPVVCKPNDVSKISFSTPTQQPVASNATPNSSSSQDEIIGQVRHESDIVQRISRLRKNGLWSASRLPKVYEQPRKKSQWDFLLEEMQWLATDFTQEKKWKRSMAKKVSRSVMKFHQDKQAFQRKMKKEETARLKRVAGGIAKEVKGFWRQIEKVACYKQQSRQEEQRRKALDLHLNFIVGQTEKYSSWLAEGMKDSPVSSVVSSRQVSDGDDDFEPDTVDAVDDEETIAEEEKVAGDGKEKYQEELDALKEESEMPIEELLKTLPSDMLARISGEGKAEGAEENKEVEEEEEEESESEAEISASEVSIGGGDEDEDNKETGEKKEEADASISKKTNENKNNDNESGEEYVANEQEMQDDEQTLDEEEALGEVDHKEEIDALQNEAEMPIEELRKMYGMKTDSTCAPNDSDSDTCDEMDSDIDSLTGDESDTANMADLVNDMDEKKTDATCDSKSESSSDIALPNQQLTDAAATAESLQPKGFTLSTTQVKTKVPFLLHHTLREYQHIGLDWLVTMYHKQLNGILADEMGLGKTIQTIALLAHLACEEEIWGPHLIVVPTSVILNWEFEFKKWCPGFKILTYFGTQKERKLKRQGWMSPNAFHVCITSYNLVLQDHQAFRRRKWKYLILDEAQNIKNFKSQRWQMLLNFHSQRRLLLTGTPLQNHLMELWSLMHFLMPNIFTSHQDFKEWFANPLTGMIEGSTEYNEGLVKRLHTVLRPFLLRRLKAEVELQMPKKYEHVMKCRLSKRQRFLYDEFMSRTKTKDTLEAGNYLSVINILMQLRKVCNHPDLFELRPTISPFQMNRLVYDTPHLVNDILTNEPPLGTCLSNYEQTMCAFQAHRTRQLKVPKHILQNLYDSNINSESSMETNEPYLQNEMCSSQFQPLSNISGDVVGRQISEAELTRSCFDCITPSQTTSGFATIGDILSRQIEQSLESANDIDVVNVDDDKNEASPPAAKKQKLNDSSSNNTNNSSNNNNDNSEKTDEKSDGKDSKTIKRNAKLGHLLDDYVADEVSPFHLQSLKLKTEEERSCRLSYGALMNERHADIFPVYGLDLHHAVKVCTCPSERFIGALMHQYKRHTYSDVLNDMIKTPARRLKERKSLSDRYLLYIYPVLCSPIITKSSHVVPSKVMERKRLKFDIQLQVKDRFDILAPMISNSRLEFPETRLVQYDCGKLQTLDYLLHRLKADRHRVLIFTQMTRMLDVLERFLNYHGFIYVRLDGSTKVDQRQILMDRFNHDQKIFVFILSTRSGGIGVNLTGADTVIFYDSDWNPTMDAQAQDRCHRIGQTRDVHIYRLISERTVEENILKKARMKRLLGDIAIEGGNFTASYFKEQSIKELFDTNNEEPIEDTTVVSTKPKEGETPTPVVVENKKEAIKFEEVLAEVEEEDDVKASRKAKIEQDSELAEFNENAPVGDNDESKVEKALATLESELKPIERFALKYMEKTNTFHVEDEVEETEKMLEAKKKEWELDHLQSIKEAEEKKHAEEDDDMFFTYARDDTYSKVINNKKTSPRKPRRRKGRTKSKANNSKQNQETESVDESIDENIDENNIPHDPSSPVHFSIQPLIMKLGGERIAQIKKVAQEAIEAKTIQNVSEFVKTRIRKQPAFFNASEPSSKETKEPENARGTPSPQHLKMNVPRDRSLSPNIKLNVSRSKPAPKLAVKTVSRPNSRTGLKSISPKPGQKSGLKTGPKPGNPRGMKTTKDNHLVQVQSAGKRGRPPLVKKPSTVRVNNTNNNQIFLKSGSPQTLQQAQQQAAPKNRGGTVTLKDFISHNLGSNFKPQAVNLGQSSISEETLQKINNVQSKYGNINVLSNGINPYIQNNVNHESFRNWNGVMPESDLSVNTTYMNNGSINILKLNHNTNTQQQSSRIFPCYDMSNVSNKGNSKTSPLSNNDVNSVYHNSNSDLSYVNTTKNETETRIISACPHVLTQLPAAASSPLHSPASSDSGGEVRRSSRTPRPKQYDNNDWLLFS